MPRHSSLWNNVSISLGLMYVNVSIWAKHKPWMAAVQSTSLTDTQFSAGGDQLIFPWCHPSVFFCTCPDECRVLQDYRHFSSLNHIFFFFFICYPYKCSVCAYWVLATIFSLNIICPRYSQAAKQGISCRSCFQLLDWHQSWEKGLIPTVTASLSWSFS